jgi:F420-0:gamma-glutamyl ligase
MRLDQRCSQKRQSVGTELQLQQQAVVDEEAGLACVTGGRAQRGGPMVGRQPPRGRRRRRDREARKTSRSKARELRS